MSNDRPKERTEIFNKRSRLTRDLAESHKRSIHAFRRNWKLKHEHFLLPRADKIFKFLEDYIRNETHSMKERYLGASEWSEVMEDEYILQTEIQDILAILRWVYWQRLEGYETADVSAIREPSFEDIGGIQQLFAAADALIEDYRSRFSFTLPYDILSVFGLHDVFEVPYPFFISAPRYAKYAFFPSWILFSHEIAHIAIRWVEDQYNKWKNSEKFLENFRIIWEMRKTKNQIERRNCLGEIQVMLLQLEIASERLERGPASTEMEDIKGFIKECKTKIEHLISLESENKKIEHLKNYIVCGLDKRGEVILDEIKCLSSRILGEIQVMFLQLEIASERLERGPASTEMEDIKGFIKECKTKIEHLISLESENKEIEHLKNYFVCDLDKRGEVILSDIKCLSSKIFSEMVSFLHSYQDQHENAFLLMEQIYSILKKIETEGIEDYQTFKSECNEILADWDNFVKKKKLMNNLKVEELNSLIAEDLGLTTTCYQMLYIWPKSFIKSLRKGNEQSNGDYELEKLTNFFKTWEEIRKRALDVAELMMRLSSGSTGRKVLHKPEPQASLHEEMASEVICDIIATLLSGEYFIYSFCFYYFLPSFRRSKNGKIKIKPSTRDPFVLRSFVCLETLICSEYEMAKVFDLLSNIYLYPSKKYETLGKEIEEYVKEIDLLYVKESKKRKFIELLKDFNIKKICEVLLKNHEEKVKKEGNFDLYIDQKKMMENLLNELLGEEESIKQYFIEARSQFKEGDEEEDLRSYYNYMGCALQEDLRLLLREGSPDPQKFEESILGSEESIPKDNSLRRLIHLVKEVFIKENGSFYDEIADFDEMREIKEISEKLKKGIIIFPSEGKKPIHFISAFCYLYFKEKLTGEEHGFEFFKALNSTILSMAWSREALERFSCGK